MQRNRLKSFSTVFILTLFLTFSASALDWSPEVLEEPYNQIQVSDEHPTLQVINLTDSEGNYVNQTELEEDEAVLNYYYNASDGENQSMESFYPDKGYYFTQFEVNSTKGGEVLFELFKENEGSEEDEVENDTQVMELGDFNVELVNNSEVEEDIFDPSMPFVAGESDTAWVNVTDQDGNHVEGVDIELYFTNITHTYEAESIDGTGPTSEYEEIYHDGFRLPSQPDSNYIMHLTVSKDEEETGYESPYGSTSLMTETYPRIEGDSTITNETGCEESENAAACERYGALNTTFEITESVADNVNVSLLAETREEGELEELKQLSMNDTTNGSEEDYEEGLEFEQQMQIPNINTSKYSNELTLRFNATDFLGYYTEDRTIDYEENFVNYLGASTASAGSYEVRFEALTGVNEDPIPPSDLNGTVNVTNPSDETVDYFNLSDMSYGSSLYNKEVDLPFGSEDGEYNVEIDLEDAYDHNYFLLHSFDFESEDQAFSVNNSLQTEINKTGNHTYDLLIDNPGKSLEIVTEKRGDIQNFTELDNSGDQIIIAPSDDSRSLELNFDIEFVDSYTGEIFFEDVQTGYNETMDIDIEAPICTDRNEYLCVSSGNLNATIDDLEDSETNILDVKYLGHKDSGTELDASLSGDIDNYSTLDPENAEMNSTYDHEVLTLNYTAPSSPGNFTGTLDLDMNGTSLNIPLNLESNVEPQDIGFDLSDNIDLGELIEGDNAEATVEIENTGDIEIESVDVSSTDYSVDADTVSIAPGETEEITLEFTDVQTESGTVNVEASGEEDSTTQSVSVESDLHQDYGELADDLEERSFDLDSRTSDNELEDQILDIQMEIPDIQTAFNEENYDEAETLYNDMEESLDSIEDQIEQEESESAGDTNGDTGDGATTPGTEEGEQGMGATIPIVAGLFVFLLIGFVAYTSIIPEEGDSLNSVLGK